MDCVCVCERIPENQKGSRRGERKKEPTTWESRKKSLGCYLKIRMKAGRYGQASRVISATTTTSSQRRATRQFCW